MPKVLSYGLLLVLFGVFLPWWKGLDFLDPTLLSAYACLGVVFAGPAAAQAFEKRPDSLTQALWRVARSAVLAEIVAVILLVCAIATVYLTHHVTFLPVDLATLGWAAVLGLAASFGIASLAAWMALRFSSATARAAVRAVLLALLVLFYLRGRWLPAVALSGVWIALAAAAVFVSLLALRMRRA